MRTEIPREWTASAATKRLSWSWTMKRRRTRAAMPETTARKAFTFGGCRLTHVVTAWIDVLWGLMGSLIPIPIPILPTQTHTTNVGLEQTKQDPNAKMQIDFFFLFSLQKFQFNSNTNRLVNRIIFFFFYDKQTPIGALNPKDIILKINITIKSSIISINLLDIISIMNINFIFFNFYLLKYIFIILIWSYN